MASVTSYYLSTLSGSYFSQKKMLTYFTYSFDIPWLYSAPNTTGLELTQASTIQLITESSCRDVTVLLF